MSEMSDAVQNAAAADRLDELAETAELMGDEATSISLRARAERLRLDEMRRLDDPLSERTDDGH